MKATCWLALLLAVFSFHAAAQEREREQLQASGTLRAVSGGAFQMATDGNELLSVKLPAKATDISFSGPADVSFLKPGMLVKFSAVVGKRGQIAEPITSLVVFTPTDRTDLGIWPENAGEGAPSPLDNLFTNPEPKPEKKPTKKIVEDQPYRIGGTLVSLKSGKMVVSAGGVQLKCDLADDAKIRVAMANLSYARQGDKVELEGWYYAGAKQAGVIASRVSVTAANTLEGEKKKVRAKSDETDEKPSVDKPSKGDKEKE